MCAAAPKLLNAGTRTKRMRFGAGGACAAVRGWTVSGGDISSGLFGTGG